MNNRPELHRGNGDRKRQQQFAITAENQGQYGEYQQRIAAADSIPELVATLEDIYAHGGVLAKSNNELYLSVDTLNEKIADTYKLATLSAVKELRNKKENVEDIIEEQLRLHYGITSTLGLRNAVVRLIMREAQRQYAGIAAMLAENAASPSNVQPSPTPQPPAEPPRFLDANNQPIGRKIQQAEPPASPPRKEQRAANLYEGPVMPIQEIIMIYRKKLETMLNELIPDEKKLFQQAEYRDTLIPEFRRRMEEINTALKAELPEKQRQPVTIECRPVNKNIVVVMRINGRLEQAVARFSIKLDRTMLFRGDVLNAAGESVL